MRTNLPTFRITRQISNNLGRKIPIEAECSACADVRFKIDYDKRSSYTPDRERMLESLKRAFDAHVAIAHRSDPIEKIMRRGKK
jgi:hypothetical protein